MEEFEITMDVFRPGEGYSPVKFIVEVYHNSDQVQRFRLKGGSKVIEFEKRLLVKRHPWKLVSMNYPMDQVNEETVRKMHQVWDLIDEHMTGKSKVSYRPH